MLEHRNLGAVRLDLLGDVVAVGRERKRGEWSHDGDAGGERVGVTVDVIGFVPPGHRDDTVVRFPADRALAAQVVEVRVGISDQRRVGEVVDGVEIGHARAPPGLCNGATEIRIGLPARCTVPPRAERLLSMFSMSWSKNEMRG